MTSIGFPVVDKAPAKTESGRVVSLGMPLERKPSENPLLQTKQGTEPPANPTAPSMPAQNPLLETKLGHAAPRADATPSKVPLQGTPPPDGGTAAKSIIVHEETTAIGQGPAKLVEPAKSITAARPLVDPIGEDEATAIGAVPMKTTDPMPAAAPKPTPPETPVATPAEAIEPQRADNPRNDSKQKATAIGFPVVGRNVFETQPLGIVPPASPFRADGTPEPPTLPRGGAAAGRSAQAPAPRGKNPTTPPLTPRHPTPVAPVPIVRPPAKAAPSVNAEDEKTDLGTAPTVPAAPVEPASGVDSGALFPAPQQRSGGMRASEILAAIPAGDWTMAPDESVPHALTTDEKLAAGEGPQEPTPSPAPAPKGPPTGDWTIQLDPETGWSEPEKLAKQPAPVASGNPVVAVSSDKPINVVQWDEKPTGIGESKIEIDSTLMEPLSPMPDGDAAQIVNKPASDVPPPLAPMPPRPTSGFGITDQAAFMPPMAPPHRQSSSDMLGGFAPMTVPIGAQDPAQRKKMILLAIAAGAVAVGAIVILVLTLGGSKRPSQAATGGSDSAVKVITPKPTQAIDAGVVAKVGSGSQQVAVDPGGSGSEIKPAPVPDKPTPVASGPCKVDIKSNPPGADIYAGAQKLGTTPDTIELPCGAEAKLTFKKKPLPNTVRSFTPAAKTNKLTVKLARTMFSVKMTSTPAGATITLGGKSLGVTPTTIKLPSFESSALTLTKPGFAPETARVNPKQNNHSQHVTLKKGKGR
ncbi:MAG TPA: PEGA domain-containing protein, partial [Kofleriaceae bacterium]